MTVSLAPLAPVVAPRSSASRCYGQATILMRRGGGLTTADAALVTPYLPGTSTPYPDPLYGGPDATAALAFPVATGGDGAVALWADAPGRLELEAVHPVLGRARGVLDLEPDPDAAPEAVDAYSKSESDARYLQAPLTEAQIPAAFLTVAEGDARYALAGAAGITQEQADLRYPLRSDPDPYPQYLTAGELTPTDVAVTTDASLTSAETPANTFALAVRLSPDAGNALALRANGLYSTDTTGAGGAYVDEAGDTMTGALVLQAAAATPVLRTKAAADTAQRFRIDSDGKLEWTHNSTGAVITALYRSVNSLIFTGDATPSATTTYNLGGTGLVWQQAYVRDVLAHSDTGFVRVGATNNATSGAVRLKNAAAVTWRNAANSADLSLTVNASDHLALTVAAGALTTTATAGRPAPSRVSQPAT